MLFQLTVNTPTISGCPKDFHAMHPVDGGAFCDHCEKQVHDLTHLSRAEIFDFYAKNPDCCVRVTKDGLRPMVQLTQERKPDLFALPRFAFALFLVFGSVLFSCSEDEYTDTLKNLESLAAQMQVQQLSMLEEADNLIADSEQTTVEEKILRYVECNCVNEELLPEIAHEPDTLTIDLDTVTVDLDTVYIERLEDKLVVTHYMGLVVMTKTVQTVALESKKMEEPKAKLPSSITAYPNPTMSSTTISYTLAKDGPMQLLVFSTTGQLIEELEFSVNALAGDYTRVMDVQQWDPGYYVVVLISGDEKHTTKIAVVR